MGATATSSLSSPFAPPPPLLPCSGRHKLRLLVGEGNFSFTEAFIQKHESKLAHHPMLSLAYSIIATELRPESSIDHPAILSRIGRLRARGVRILTGIDATAIHRYFPGARFDRIHWNGPCGGRATYPSALLIPFFHSCALLQYPKDRVHIVIDQPEGMTGTTPSPYYYQGFRNEIVKAASQAGYAILRKRQFSSARYPGYQPVDWDGRSRSNRMREFVFEKIDPARFAFIRAEAHARAAVEGAPYFGDSKEGDFLTIPLAEQLMSCAEKSHRLVLSTERGSLQYASFECVTDEDSSGCEL